MKEFMLFIRNEGDAKAAFTPAQHQEFLKACEVYIEKLVKNGHLKSAQPLVREGSLISGTPGKFRETGFQEGKEVIVGYYHVLAEDLNDAIAIAKENPELAYTATARIEVRPVKMKEESTSFVYPSGQR